jgi:YegS/Rv2252/BmrU family lipid kinase
LPSPSGRTVFLVNPASDNGATDRRWPQLAHELALAGLTGDALFSSAPGQLGGLARKAADDGATVLVVVGGDGSLFEVANGVAGRGDVEIAAVPRGTGRDFFRTFGLSSKPAEVAATVLHGTTRPLDLGRVTYRSWSGGKETAFFANVASAGMSGAIAQRANDTSKAFGGKASYAWATLAVFAGWKNGEVHVEVDGEIREGRMQDVVVANGRYFGGGMKICPEAEPDDGLFDVLLIGDVTRRELVQTMPKLYRGTHLPHKKGELLRGRVVTVESAEPLPVELDGEQPGTTPARFELVPAALRLRVPR